MLREHHFDEDDTTEERDTTEEVNRGTVAGAYCLSLSKTSQSYTAHFPRQDGDIGHIKACPCPAFLRRLLCELCSPFFCYVLFSADYLGIAFDACASKKQDRLELLNIRLEQVQMWLSILVDNTICSRLHGISKLK